MVHNWHMFLDKKVLMPKFIVSYLFFRYLPPQIHFKKQPRNAFPKQSFCSFKSFCHIMNI